MKEIPLTQGKVALVDNADFEWLSEFSWCLRNSGRRSYASSWVSGKYVQMHRLILQVTPKQSIDHINSNTLDNRRCNLRLCNQSLNLANSRRHRNGSSRFKGVMWYKRDHNWTARIKKDYHSKHLGYFESEEEAARAYDKAAKELFGEFARTNEMMGLI